MTDEELRLIYMSSDIKSDSYVIAGLRAVEDAVRADQIEKDARVCADIVTTPWNENHREYWKGFSDGTSVAEAAIRTQLQLNEGNNDE